MIPLVHCISCYYQRDNRCLMNMLNCCLTAHLQLRLEPRLSFYLAVFAGGHCIPPLLVDCDTRCHWCDDGGTTKMFCHWGFSFLTHLAWVQQASKHQAGIDELLVDSFDFSVNTSCPWCLGMNQPGPFFVWSLSSTLMEVDHWVWGLLCASSAEPRVK